MKNFIFLISVCLLSATSVSLRAETVMEDEGVALSRAELEETIRRWTPEMRRAAADDLGDRMELLNVTLARKKMAARVDEITLQGDQEAYWNYQFELLRLQNRFVYEYYMATLEVPDMSALAAERYATEKDKYALVPETRASSHILLKCPPGCDREPFRAQAQALLDQLAAGADFEQLVAEYSDDASSKARQGKLKNWISFGQARVSPNYSKALFEIEEVGGYSPVVETEFGVHIIRLDGIRDAYHRPFEEVRDTIIAALEGEYRELKSKEFKASFRVTENVRIDGDVVDELFAPYKTGAEGSQ